jgi:glycosyltransferase involved in cell wall biosynthesis
LPARSSGQSLAVLEAMAAGVPVVACDNGGNRQVLVHEEHGLLVPPQDSAALSSAIEQSLSDRALAQRLGSQARQRAGQEFSLERMAKGYLAVIEEAINSRSS